jgi:hypothetical protein
MTDSQGGIVVQQLDGMWKGQVLEGGLALCQLVDVMLMVMADTAAFRDLPCSLVADSAQLRNTDELTVPMNTCMPSNTPAQVSNGPYPNKSMHA